MILTGLDEEGDSTDDEMPLPPLEPLEGAAQLGVVWLRGHGKGGCDPLVMPAHSQNFSRGVSFEPKVRVPCILRSTFPRK